MGVLFNNIKEETKSFFDENYYLWISNSRHSIRNQYLALFGDVMGKRGLDVGCGLGIDAELLSEKGASGVGVDISMKSIRIAAEKKIQNWDFYTKDSESLSIKRFDFVLSAMELMYHDHLDGISKVYSSYILPGGKLLIVINNPYIVALEYNLEYNSKSVYLHNFVSLGIENFKIHRPIKDIINAFASHELRLYDFQEICCTNNDCRNFNQINKLEFPEFIALLFIKS